MLGLAAGRDASIEISRCDEGRRMEQLYAHRIAPLSGHYVIIFILEILRQNAYLSQNRPIM